MFPVTLLHRNYAGKFVKNIQLIFFLPVVFSGLFLVSGSDVIINIVDMQDNLRKKCAIKFSAEIRVK